MPKVICFCFLMVCSQVRWAYCQSLQGDTLYEKKAYHAAIPYYKNALDTSKDSVTACHCKKRLAKCYDYLNEVKEAEHWHRELIKTCKTEIEDFRNLARIFQKTGEYEKAKKLFSSCYQSDSTDRFSLFNMHFCDTIKRAYDKITDVYLEPILETNTAFDEILTEANNDTLFFLSSRKWDKKEAKTPSNGHYRYKLFQWSPGNASTIRPLSPSSVFFTSDGENEEGFYSTTTPSRASSESMRSVIYKRKLSLTEPQKFAFDDDKSNYGHPNLSPDGTFFFFVSDMPGGFGGMDIYYCRKTGNRWTAPINLGPEVNTPYNELLPFYLGEGLLFFASNGHATFGGYDVYATTFRNNNWTFPYHLPLPINSKGDDIGIQWDRTKKTFYITSNRNKGKGGYDIYQLQKMEVEDLAKIKHHED